MSWLGDPEQEPRWHVLVLHTQTPHLVPAGEMHLDFDGHFEDEQEARDWMADMRTQGWTCLLWDNQKQEMVSR